MRPFALLLAPILASIALAGCATNKASKEKEISDEEPSRGGEKGPFDEQGGGFGSAGGPGTGSNARPEVAPSVDYAETAEENWSLGEKAFKEEEYQVAQRYYAHIRTKFPYSQYTATSELRIGDCLFARSRYVEAIDAYQSFARLHPNHEKVPYAMLRIGRSYYEQIPGDWFLLPPSEEKEQTVVREAERALRDYVERFPKDEGIDDGKGLLADVRKRLLAHERYVAEFYRKIGKPRAYVGRLEVIRRDYADVGLDDSLLFDITATWAKLGELDRARAAAQELADKFPSSSKRAEAQALVGKAEPAAAPAPAPTSDTSSG